MKNNERLNAVILAINIDRVDSRIKFSFYREVRIQTE